MSPEIIGVIGVAVLIVLILFRCWIGAAMAIVGIVGIILLKGVPAALMTLQTVPFSKADDYALTVIPMFTMMGMVIAETNIGTGLYDAGYKWFGYARGGMASATVVASGLMGAITGSDQVSSIIMSRIALPEMKRFQYEDAFAAASVSAGAPLAIIIPPSLPFILYGILTEQSVGKLFVSGIVPGIMLVVAYIICISIMCAINPKLGGKGERFPMKERLKSLIGIAPTVILFVLVLGGIYLGLCTTTEAGAIGAGGSLLIALVTKQLNWKKFKKIMVETAFNSGFVLFLMLGTNIFIQFIALSKLPFVITGFVTGLPLGRTVILLLVAVMYIILGMCLPQNTLIVLTIPLIYPAMMALGYDPIWFGLFVVMMVALGAISPPIGLDVFIVSGIANVPIPKVFYRVLPFIIADLIVLLLVSVFPQLVTFLPGLM